MFLYRFRVYQDTLTMPEVIHNYLSDLHSIKLYDENDLARLTDPTELDYDRLVKYYEIIGDIKNQNKYQELHTTWKNSIETIDF